MSGWAIFACVAGGFVYVVGALMLSHDMKELEELYPKNEIPGRVVLWPLFAALWIVVAILTGLRTFVKSVAGASEKLDVADDDEIDDEEPEAAE